MARTVLDAALLHEAIGGHDPLDSTSIDAPVPVLAECARRGAEGDLSGLKVGVVRELGGEGHREGYEQGVLDRVAEAVALLEGMGAEVREISCPAFDLALAAYYLIAPSEASSNLARFDGVRYGLRAGDDGSRDLDEVMALTREQGFGAEVKRRIILGTYALSSGYYEAYYGQAQKVRTLITRDFTAGFDQVDVLVSPTTPTVAFPLGSRVDDPVAMYAADLCTLPGQPRRRPGHLGALRTVRRPAGRLPDHGPGARRRPLLPGGRGARGRLRWPADRPASEAVGVSGALKAAWGLTAFVIVAGALGWILTGRVVFAVFIVLGVLTAVGALVTGRTERAASKEEPTP